jgi:hypothetical protein
MQKVGVNLSLSIDFAPMSYSNYLNEFSLIIDQIYCPVIPNSNTIGIIFAFYLFATGWSRASFEGKKFAPYPPRNWRRKFIQIAFGSGL